MVSQQSTGTTALTSFHTYIHTVNHTLFSVDFRCYELTNSRKKEKKREKKCHSSERRFQACTIYTALHETFVLYFFTIASSYWTVEGIKKYFQFYWKRKIMFICNNVSERRSNLIDHWLRISSCVMLRVFSKREYIVWNLWKTINSMIEWNLVDGSGCKFHYFLLIVCLST